MGLLLAVEGSAPLPQNLQPDGNIIVGERLTLGRSSDNDLVLDDEHETVAEFHCLIFNAEGRYQVLDHSGGGTVMNEAATPLSSDGPVPLTIGDSLRIGTFRLTVMGTPQGEQPGEPQAVSPSADGGPLPGSESDPTEPELLERVLMAEEGADYLIRPDDGEPPWDEEGDSLFPENHAASQADHLAPVHEAYIMPRHGTEIIPEDWDLLEEAAGAGDQEHRNDFAAHPGGQVSRTETVEQDPPLHPPVALHTHPLRNPGHQPDPRSAPEAGYRALPDRPGPPPDPGAAIAAFCRGAGLDPGDLPQGGELQAMEMAGQLLTTGLTGLSMLLADCARQGQEFSAPGNRIPGGELTNPLSLPGTSRDTLRLLLRGPLPGLLPGDAAIARACAGVAEQQEGLMNRMRQAMAAVTDSLAPDAIAGTMEPPSIRGRLRGLLGGPDGFRHAYERRHREVAAGMRVLGGQPANGDATQDPYEARDDG